MISEDDPVLRRQVGRFAPTMVGGTVLLLLAADTSGDAQLLLWFAAVVADYGGTLAIGARGWRLNSARHFAELAERSIQPLRGACGAKHSTSARSLRSEAFNLCAERHGLMVIIALGESIVAIGVGVTHLAISWPIVVAATLGLAVAASLWWAYFDTAAILGEQALASAKGDQRVAMARTAFTYLHLPMMVGIVMLALGMKKVLTYVGDTEHHALSDPLYGAPLWALYGGTALYLLAHVGFAWRCFRAVKAYRLGAAVVLVTLNVVETVVFRAARDEARHGGHEHHG